MATNVVQRSLLDTLLQKATKNNPSLVNANVTIAAAAQDVLSSGARIRRKVKHEVSNELQHRINQLKMNLLEKRRAALLEKDHSSAMRQLRCCTSETMSFIALEETSFAGSEKEITKLIELYNKKLEFLAALVGVPEGDLPFQYRFCADMNVGDEEYNDVGCASNTTTNEIVELTGRIVDEATGRDQWSDYCGVCGIEIEANETRFRCFDCTTSMVWCSDCWSICGQQHYLQPALHHNTEHMVVKESAHPLFPRLELSSDSLCLSCFLQKMFLHAYPQRPLFGKFDASHNCFTWKTYSQTFNRIVFWKSCILEDMQVCKHSPTDSFLVGLCMHNCPEWLELDIASILCDSVVSVGIHADLSGEKLMEMVCSAGINVVYCENEEIATRFNHELVRIRRVDLLSSDIKTTDFNPDITNSCTGSHSDPKILYSLFFTSGTSGSAAKGVMVPRTSWLKECREPSAISIPLVYYSWVDIF